MQQQISTSLIDVDCEMSTNIKTPENMTLLGRVSDQVKLAKLYSLADLTVIASKKETFSMIVAESLSCGTPVVGFSAGGPESITIEEYSEFVDYGNTDALIGAAERLSELSSESEIISGLAHDKYSKKNMFENYQKHYTETEREG